MHRPCDPVPVAALNGIFGRERCQFLRELVRLCDSTSSEFLQPLVATALCSSGRIASLETGHDLASSLSALYEALTGEVSFDL